MFYKLRKKEENERRWFYRLREDSTESMVNTKFSYIEDHDEAKELINQFLDENKNFSIISTNIISYEVYGKPAKILKGKNNVLEVDDRLYQSFRNEIETALNTYKTNVIKSWGILDTTLIRVNTFNSGIKINEVVCDPTSVVDVGFKIEELLLNVTNRYDNTLLQNILDCFLENKTGHARIEDVKEGVFYLVCDDKKLMFDSGARNIVTDKMIEHNRNLNKQIDGIAYTKTMKEGN